MIFFIPLKPIEILIKITPTILVSASRRTMIFSNETVLLIIYCVSTNERNTSTPKFTSKRDLYHIVARLFRA